MMKPVKKRMGRPSSSHELTAKQARFVALYLADPALNAQHAAMAAGYAPTTAAARLMNRPPVQAAIAKGMQARSDRTQITQDDVPPLTPSGVIAMSSPFASAARTRPAM